MLAAHQKKRVAGDDFAEADERRVWLDVAGLHDPHGPAPREVDRVIKQPRRAVTRNRRVDKFDVDTFLTIQSERLCGIIRRVKEGAKVFSEPDGHERSAPDRESVPASDIIARSIH